MAALKRRLVRRRGWQRNRLTLLLRNRREQFIRDMVSSIHRTREMIPGGYVGKPGAFGGEYVINSAINERILADVRQIADDFAKLEHYMYGNMVTLSEDKDDN